MECVPRVAAIPSRSGSRRDSPVTHRERKTSRKCALIPAAFKAVDTLFQVLPEEIANLIAGATAKKEGTWHAVPTGGVGGDWGVSQRLNEPEQLRNRVEELTEGLLEEGKTSLNIYDLGETIQVAQELKEQLMAEEPDPALIRQSARILALLGHIEGSFELMTSV